MYNIERAPPNLHDNSWYEEVHHYIKHDTLPSHISMWHKRELHLKSLSYQLVQGVLYRKNNNKILLRCLEAQDSERVLHDMQDGIVGGHFIGNTIAHRVMRAIFYWPTLFKDANSYAHKFLVCQRCAKKTWRSAAPLHPVAVDEPFQQWGLDIIGEILPHSSKQHHYILTTKGYFMWWMEAVPLKQVND